MAEWSQSLSDPTGRINEIIAGIQVAAHAPTIDEYYLYTLNSPSGPVTRHARFITVTETRAPTVGNAQSGGGVNTDAWGIGMDAFGFANEVKMEIIDYAVRKGSSQSGIRAELQVLGKAGTRYLNAFKGLSTSAGPAGIAVTGIDAWQNGQWQNHHTADVIIGLGMTFMLSGPWGWVAGGAYFLTDLGVTYYIGKSITEN